MEEEINKEVEARIRFKTDQIFTSLKNHSNAFKARAWNPRLSGKETAIAMENSMAFDTIKEIIEKEIKMAVPYQKMNEEELKERRNNAVEKILVLFGIEGARKVNSVVRIVEELLGL